MALRQFTEKHIKEDCTTVTGRHTNGLFYECKFNKLNGLALENCDLNQSTFETSHVRDALGFTLSMNCLSFRGVKFSPLLFDMFLLLASMSEGNDEKREKLLDVVGRDRAAAMLRVLRETE